MQSPPQDSIGAQRRKRRFSPFTLFLGLACGVLAAQVLLLVRANRRLVRALGEEKGREEAGASVPSQRLVVGERFPPFVLRDSSGAEQRVEFDGGDVPTLLFVFAERSPSCPAAVASWNRLADA